MENTWSNALGLGKEVLIEIQAIYDQGTLRPSAFNVKYKIGDERWITQLFTNIAGG